MGNNTSATLLLHVASAAALALGLVVGCSGSSSDGSGGGTPESQPVQVASSQGPTAPPPGSAAPPGSGAPGGGGSTPAPKQCAAAADCTGACPPEARGCTCADAPDGKRCLPTCTTDQDCPALPGGALVCSAQKVCMPR